MSNDKNGKNKLPPYDSGDIYDMATSKEGSSLPRELILIKERRYFSHSDSVSESRNTYACPKAPAKAPVKVREEKENKSNTAVKIKRKPKR